MSHELARNILSQLGLMPLLRGAREALLTAKFVRANRAFLAANGVPSGLPLPPARLRILVAGSPDIAWFLEGGRRGADSIREALARNGMTLQSAGPVLDFGCGCGRVLRHFMNDPVALSGSDLNPRLIGWCREHLHGARFETNGLNPPLAFNADEFGLVYALSVFTHLPAPLQLPWLGELARVIRPGGYLLFSTHGARYADQLSADERGRLEAGQLVVRHEDRPGSNACGVYHPAAYVRHNLPPGLAVVDHIPEGARGNPYQDLWLLRKA